MKLKQLERSFWVFLTGILFGFIFYTYIYFQQYGYQSISSKKNDYNLSVPKKLVPYYYFINQSLEYLMEHYIDKKNLNYKELFLGAVDGMYKAVGDPYTNFLNASFFSNVSEDIVGEIGGIGMYLQNQNGSIKVISIIPNSPAAKKKIQLNDEIKYINGQDVSDKDLDSVIEQLQGKVGTKITLTLYRHSLKQTSNVVLKREYIHIQSVKSFEINPYHIGYIKINKFTDATPTEVKRALSGLLKRRIQSLIIDMRDNPGGSLQSAIDVSNFFIQKGLILETRGPNSEENESFFADPKKMIFPSNKSIMILVNGESASAAEIVAGTLKDHKRAKIVGEQTFGKGAVQSIFPIKLNNEEIGYKITVANYYTPGGYVISHKGITPDYRVSLPKVPTSIEAQIDSLINEQILHKILKEKLKNPINQKDYDNLKKELTIKGYYIPDLFLKKIIHEQRDLLHGILDSVDLNYDTQLQKAIKLLKRGK